MGRINATPAEITGETRLDDQYGMKMQAMAALHWQYPEGNTPKRGFDEPLPRCRTLARLFATTTVRCILLNVMCVQVKAKTEWFPGRGIRGIPSQSWVKCDLELQLGPELVDERILLGDRHLPVVVALSILDAPAGHVLCTRCGRPRFGSVAIPNARCGEGLAVERTTASGSFTRPNEAIPFVNASNMPEHDEI